MEINSENLIKLLNTDLSLEYSAAIQYIQHAAVITDAQYVYIIKELKIHAREEVEHAMVLANQIVLLGGVPTIDVSKISTSEIDEKLLKQDLEGEEGAITRYKTRIKQAELLKEFTLAQHLKNILSTEQEHAEDLKKALKEE